MRAPSQVQLENFTVDVQFFSDGEHYATQTYRIEAADWYRAQRDALEMSVSSVYDDPRIPALTRRAAPR